MGIRLVSVDEYVNTKIPTLGEMRETMGARARQRRLEMGLTLAEAAARMAAAGRPVGKAQLSKLERNAGASPPSMRDLAALAHALRVHPAFFLLDADTADVTLAHLDGGLRAVLMVAATRAK